MISVSGRKWQEKKINEKLAEKIEQDYDLSKILSKLIVSRNFDKDEIFVVGNDLKLTNKFKNTSDFIEAVNLIEKAIINKEKICILGDYDIDGSVSTSMLVNLFKSINHPYFYYIPDRVKDGYGASKKLFQKLILKKPRLVIMVDCGSTSINAIDYLNKNNIKSLVIDHHEISKPYPKANVIINPKKNNGYLEYEYFCASTLTFFFLDLLSKKIKSKNNLQENLINVLLATVCDVMPLRKLNRLISKIALKEFNINNNYVYKKIYELSDRKNKISINDLGYLIGPILNAGGRLGKSNYATELLSTNDSKIIDSIASKLIILNNKRKLIEAKILNDIDLNELNKINDPIIIYYDPNINEGLIGIIASRLKDYFNKPAFIITNSNNLLKGSARSINNYDIGIVIKTLLDKKIILSGGGHNMAAGFALERKNLPNFRDFIKNDYSKKNIQNNDNFYYDAEISPTIFKNNFFDEIKKIEPFGTGNPLPTFLFKELKVIKSKILNKKNIFCILKSKIGFSINSIYFNSTNTNIGEHLLNYKKKLNVVGQISENFWNNKKNLQLIIKDLIL